MDREQQILVRTKAGEQALVDPVRLLQHNLRRVLALVDGRSTVAQIRARLRDEISVLTAVEELLNLEFVTPTQPWTEASLDEWDEPRAAVRQNGADLPLPARFPSQAGTGVEAGQGSTTEQPRRSTFPSGRRHWGRVAFAAILVLLVGVFLVFPYARYVPLLEARLGHALNQPVKVSALGVTLLPRPALTVSGLAIGRAGELQTGPVRLVPDSWMFLSGAPGSFVLELDELDAKAQVLSDVLLTAQGVGRNPDGWRIKGMSVDKLRLSFAQRKLEALRGELAFAPDGTNTLTLRNGSRELRVAVQRRGGSTEVRLSSLDWSLGGLNLIGLEAGGQLEGQGLALSRLEAGLLGGRVQGRTVLNWSGYGSGELDFQRLDMDGLQKLLALETPLRGDLSGKVRFEDARFFDPSPFEGMPVVGAFHLQRGSMNKVDLVGAIREGNGVEVRGGATGFDDLEFSLTGRGGEWRLSGMKLKSGALTATGEVQVHGGSKLEGSLTVQLADKLRTAVAIGGSLASPVLRGMRKG